MQRGWAITTGANLGGAAVAEQSFCRRFHDKIKTASLPSYAIWLDMCLVCYTVATISCSALFVPGNVVYSFGRGWGGQVAPTSGAIEF